MKKSYILFIAFCMPFFSAFCQDFGTMEFIENKGQWDSRVKFMAKSPAGGIFINADGFTVLQHNTQDWETVTDILHGHPTEEAKRIILGNEKFNIRSHAYKVEFINASANAAIVADKPLYTYNNYFIGNDPAKWAANCSMYQGVTVRNIYPGVDVRYYSNNGLMKYDLIVNPGADISKIALRYKGADKLEVKNKELIIHTSVGDLRELDPYTYQFTEKGKKEITAKYVVKGNELRFDVKNYDKSAALIIDPSLVFCSFSGSRADNWGFTATYGPDGSMYGGGIVADNGFPVSTGAFQTNFAGGTWDIGVIKLSPDGRNRMYATYVGGGGIEQPHSLVVDAGGNLIIAGRSNSTNYPVTGGTAGQIGPGGSYDIVVTKLNAAGNQLIGSKKIGGSSDDGANISPNRLDGARSLQRNYGDDGRSEVIVDGGGNIYVASCTQSKDFPIRGGFQSAFGGGVQDGVLLKFSADVSNLTFCSYLGGSGNDAAYVLSLHPFNNTIYVAGGTESTDFPGTRSGSVISSSNIGSIDGFVAMVSNNGSSLIRSTYVGTGGIDQVYGVQFDKFGFPYIMGQTTGSWPIVAPPENPNPWSQSGGKQFIAKLEQDLSKYVYSTVFGTGSAVPNISPVAFLVDRCENVYVSGWGGEFESLKFPSAGTSGLTVTPDAIKSTTDIGRTGVGQDFYFFVLKRNATDQLYGSFFGQNGGAPDHVDGGTSRFDRNGVIYQAICANCKTFGLVPFPTTPGSWSTTNPSQSCNLAMVKIEFNLAGVRAGIQPAIDGVPRDSAGCVPLTVDFRDTVQNQDKRTFEWDFADGSPVVKTTVPQASHTFNQVGTYRVMLIAIDSSTCNIRDTSYVNIRVGDIKADLNFNPVKLNPCDSFKYRFDNLSTTVPQQPFTNQSFSWDFGDGSPVVIGGLNSVFHNYNSAGTYTVKMKLLDSAYCNYPDSVVRQIRISALVKAIIDTPQKGCAPYTIEFKNESLGGQNFQWTFGDGRTSTEVNPVITYTVPGVYKITLVAFDSATCNRIDSTSTTVEVLGKPKADFNPTPQPPQVNTPTTFTNLSSPDAVRFKWLFGDDDSLITVPGQPVQHEYNVTGTFNACLIAYNSIGCPDTVCKTIETLVKSAVDVPNAFTPLRGDINSVVKVRGYGIGKMKFIIWNRWGQKVFESDSKNYGWDGRFKGVVQPMDVYAYTLEVEFTDGKRVTKKGDITLIR